MNYRFGVYGDSIAFGYGNNNTSWFDISFQDNSIKLAQNGCRIEDVWHKINKDFNCYETLFFAIGINNLLLSHNKHCKIDFDLLIKQYEEILKIAQNRASYIIVQSLLPVLEELFPKQDWLDEDKWIFNTDIKAFNDNLGKLCNKYNVRYLDLYDEFYSLDLKNFYIDALHLNNMGQKKLANFYKKFIANIF